MKKLIIKSFDKVIVVLLGVLGIFNSCEQPDMYGMPPERYNPRYRFHGIVTDKETSNPIQNIRVVGQGDTIYTDTEGKFLFPSMNAEFHLKIEDIDGEANGGEFETQEIDVTFTDADVRVKTQNIKLEKKSK